MAYSGLDKAISVAGGTAALAAKLGTSIQVVSNWKRRQRVPANQCREIERVLEGSVTCAELRSDVFGNPEDRPQ